MTVGEARVLQQSKLSECFDKRDGFLQFLDKDDITKFLVEILGGLLKLLENKGDINVLLATLVAVCTETLSSHHLTHNTATAILTGMMRRGLQHVTHMVGAQIRSTVSAWCACNNEW